MYCNQELTYEKLVGLNKKLKDVTNEMLRQAAFKSEAIQQGMIIEDFINSKRAVELGAKKMIYSLHFAERNLDSRIDRWLGWMQYTWYVQTRPIALKIAAVLLALCSLIVILCELTFYFDLTENYLYNLFVRYSLEPGTKSFFMANLVCLLPLGYICASANFGMFSFKISSIYALHPH
jgi:hypothetical protein